MGIKIKGLKIRNFRCIGELDLDFTDPDGNPLDLIVLAGPNGCGKTSVLEAILIACGHKQLMVASAENPLSNVKIGAENFEIEADALIDDESTTWTWRIVVHESVFRVLGEPDRPKGPVIKECDSCPIHLRIRRDETPMSYFTSWRRQKLVPSLPVSDERKDKEATPEEIDRLFSLQRRCINLWVHSSLNGRDPTSDPRVQAIIDPLEKVWEIFYPGEKAQFLIRSVDKDDPDKDVNLYLRKGDGTEVPVNDLSSGEIEVLTMAGWFTMNDYRDGIVLIDEPEMHMHMQWHRAMMRALRVLLPETQIIVATHSWDILKSVMSYERFTLLREGDPRIVVDSKAVIR